MAGGTGFSANGLRQPRLYKPEMPTAVTICTSGFSVPDPHFTVARLLRVAHQNAVDLHFNSTAHVLRDEWEFHFAYPGGPSVYINSVLNLVGSFVVAGFSHEPSYPISNLNGFESFIGIVIKTSGISPNLSKSADPVT